MVFDSEIFTRPHRMPVINALRKIVGQTFDRFGLQQVDLAVELGCGSGFFYRELASPALKRALIGVDNHGPSLALFKKLAPAAKVQLELGQRLSFSDNSVDLVTGYSVYPLLSKSGVIEEILRVLKPCGRLIAFQDSGVMEWGKDKTAYEQMKSIEEKHIFLRKRLSLRGFNLLGGEDPGEATIISSYEEVVRRIPSTDLDQISDGKIVVALTDDLGVNRLRSSFPDKAVSKLREVVKELGASKVPENLTIKPGEEVMEYARLRYIVAEKPV